jgi:hypothetical protein
MHCSISLGSIAVCSAIDPLPLHAPNAGSSLIAALCVLTAKRDFQSWINSNDYSCKYQTLRIYEQTPLSALHLLSCRCRNRALLPPSAVFTKCRSTMPAPYSGCSALWARAPALGETHSTSANCHRCVRSRSSGAQPSRRESCGNRRQAQTLLSM